MCRHNGTGCSSGPVHVHVRRIRRRRIVHDARCIVAGYNCTRPYDAADVTGDVTGDVRGADFEKK